MARVLLLDNGTTHDVFEVVDVTEGLVRVRAPYLFEVGEELHLQVDGAAVTGRVRAHVGTTDKITELEITR
jgi:hypothetical protein